MQEEVQQVYDKYGTSMMGGCLQMLIQMPLLFALYPVVYDIENYIPAIKDAPAEVNRFLTIPDLTISPTQMISNSGSFGLPAAVIIVTAILIPVLSGAVQYISIRLSQAISGQQVDKDNPMASTMKTMNVTMPLFSVFIAFSFSAGIGLYWIVSAVVRCVQQIFINKSLKKMSVEDLIEKNKEKAEKKNKSAENVQNVSTQWLRLIQRVLKSLQRRMCLRKVKRKKKRNWSRQGKTQAMQNQEVWRQRQTW